MTCFALPDPPGFASCTNCPMLCTFACSATCRLRSRGLRPGERRRNGEDGLPPSLGSGFDALQHATALFDRGLVGSGWLKILNVLATGKAIVLSQFQLWDDCRSVEGTQGTTR